MFISLVFSFRNEEAVLEELLLRVGAALAPLDIGYELIFVNDDSTDRSLEILLAARRTDERIKILSMSRRFGVTPCILAGIRESRGDAVVYLDADLQDPPELLPRLIEKWQGGADVVNTVRTKRYGENFFKMWLTRNAYRAIDSLSEIDLPVNMGDFKLLSRRVADELLGISEYDPYLRGMVRWVGFRQETVFYEREVRHSGKTHFPLLGRAPVSEFIRAVTSFSAAPLYAMVIVGMAVSMLSLLAIVYVLWVKLQGQAVPGWAGPTISSLLTGAVILLSNGFLGLYIGRIYSQVKNRPLYIVKDRIGFDDREGRSREREGVQENDRRHPGIE
jgi:glycosyltransferase involved in cell wall biosynthesis